jgi:hypothetical protein
MRLNATLLGTVSVLLGALSPIASQAVPVTYSFSTGPVIVAGDAVSPLLAGLSVSGTFDYDSSVAASGTDVAGPTAGATAYAGALSNLSGSVGGSFFSDPAGAAVVGNDTYLPADPDADIFVLRANPLPGPYDDFTGFDLGAFRLVNVRMFWIEGLLPGTPDFLSSQDLPGALPAFAGRLALDFVPTAGPGGLTFVFLDGFRAAALRVPEPGALSLLSLGLLGFGLKRRRGPNGGGA